MLWFETATPDLAEAKKFAERIHADFPDQMLAYNCSPSFNWKAKIDGPTIAKFQRELGAMGYKFQFVTLAGFHALNYSMFKLAHGYRDRGMEAYSELQEAEFAAESDGYSATKHQHEVGTGYFDEVANVIAGGESSTAALRVRPKKSSFIETCRCFQGTVCAGVLCSGERTRLACCFRRPAENFSFSTLLLAVTREGARFGTRGACAPRELAAPLNEYEVGCAHRQQAGGALRGRDAPGARRL